MTAPRPLRLAIGEVRISAASGLDARRLADALPAAIERALAARSDGVAGRRPGLADEAAAQVAQAVVERLGTGR